MYKGPVRVRGRSGDGRVVRWGSGERQVYGKSLSELVIALVDVKLAILKGIVYSISIQVYIYPWNLTLNPCSSSLFPYYPHLRRPSGRRRGWSFRHRNPSRCIFGYLMWTFVSFVGGGTLHSTHVCLNVSISVARTWLSSETLRYEPRLGLQTLRPPVCLLLILLL